MFAECRFNKRNALQHTMNAGGVAIVNINAFTESEYQTCFFFPCHILVYVCVPCCVIVRPPQPLTLAASSVILSAESHLFETGTVTLASEALLCTLSINPES
jgi:hypothetical protein